MKRVNHKQLSELVEIYYKQKAIDGRKSALIVYGTFGVGKSSIVKDTAQKMAKEKGKEYIEWNKITEAQRDDVYKNSGKYFVLLDIRLSEFDSSDIKGLPDYKDRDSIYWKVPFWAKLLEKEDSDGILFFDEMNLACFKRGTQILTNKGFMPIELIQKDDKVLDINGAFSSVKAIQETQYNGKIYSIKSSGCEKLEATPNHPFLVIEKYRKSNKRWNVKETISKPKWKRAEDLEIGDYTAVQNLVEIEQKKESIITPTLSKFLGMYVANGCSEKKGNYYRINLSYGKYKKEIRKEVENVLRKVFIKKHIGISIRDNCYNYRLGITKEFYDFINKECGVYAENKKIPNKILFGKEELYLPFIEGYLSGDGCEFGNGITQYATKSKVLALGLQILYARQGTLATINKDNKIRTCFINGRKIVYEGGYTIRITDNLKARRKTKHFFIYDNKLWTKIRKIKSKEEFVSVYNFEVENSNTYTANNILTHNTPLVISSTYKIIYDRIINESKVNDNWLIMGAGNNEDDRAYTHELSAPVRDRGGEVELISPSADSWSSWAIDNGIDSRIIGFINFKPSNLHSVDYESSQKFTTERGWARLNTLIKGIENYEQLELICGSAIGEGIAREFLAFSKISKQINLDEIIKNPEKIRDVKGIDTRYFIVSALADWLKEKKVTFPKIIDISRELDMSGSADFVVLLWRLSAKSMSINRFDKELSKLKPEQYAIVQKYSKFIV